MDDSANGHSTGSQPESEALRRAEERLGDWGRRAGRFLSVAAARTREEAEDIMAEAQSIRRGERD